MIAVKLHGENLDGIPSEWPKQVIENQDSLPSGYDLLLSKEDYETYRNDRQHLYDAYLVTEDEKLVKEEIIQSMEIQKEQAIQERLKNQVVEQFQAIENNADLLENSFMFPFWEVGIPVVANQKYQAFDGLELKLYRVVQSHTTQEGWEPPITPALFARVALPDEILPWVQPAGAHDSYQLGDRVTHNGQTWESTHNGSNIWEPGVYGWKEI